LSDLGTGILAPAELVDYRALAPEARPHALAVWWSRKEAVLKATGAGLTLPMRSVAVTAPTRPAALRSPRAGRTAMLALRDLTPREGLVGCVAAVGVTWLDVTERDGDELLAGATPGAGRPLPSGPAGSAARCPPSSSWPAAPRRPAAPGPLPTRHSPSSTCSSSSPPTCTRSTAARR